MNSIMKIKLALKKFAGKNEAFLIPILKFLLTFMALTRINNKIGFMDRLNSMPITLIISLAGSFLPLNLTLVIVGLVVVAHLYALSLEVAVVVLALFLILYLLYFRFAANDSYAGMLTPLSFVWHMPYVMPVSMGLVGTPSSMVSVGSGVIIYEVLKYIADNFEELTSGEAETKLGQFKVVIDALLGNREMFVMVLAFAIAVLVVYIIRRLPIKFAWQIAIAVGELALLFVTLIGGAALSADIAYGSLFIGVIVSTIVNFILQYFLFDLNYNKVEKVQFEDDEYYYYVKAVPKNEYVSKRPVKRKVVVKQRTQAQPVEGDAKPVQRVVQQRPANATASQAERTAAAIRNSKGQ